MRRKYYYVIVAALMLSLAGCESDKQDNQKEQGNITTEGSQKDQDTVTTEHGQAQAKDEKLTLEYVCEEFNIDESEFDGVDFDAFVSYYGLTYENIGEGDPRFLLNDYKELQDRTEIPDYAALKITTNKFLPEYQDQVETVIVEHVEGETCQTTVIDLKLGKVFTTNGNIENLSADDIVGAADDATKDAIINSMNNRNICNWEAGEAENVEQDSDITGTEASCTIIIKMSDDICNGISYKSGDGSGDMDGFVSDMEALVLN